MSVKDKINNVEAPKPKHETVKMSFEIGVNAGYSEDNTQDVGIEKIGALLQESAKKIMEETGLYVSTVVNGPNRTVYHTDWGCPVGGELTYTVSSIANPEFTPDINKWKEAVLILANDMKEQLEQSTVSVEFASKNGPEIYYLNSPEAIKECIADIEASKKSINREEI